MTEEPIAEQVETARCPLRNRHRKVETLRAEAKDTYRCGCGCVFEWHDPFTWEVLDDDA